MSWSLTQSPQEIDDVTGNFFTLSWPRWLINSQDDDILTDTMINESSLEEKKQLNGAILDCRTISPTIVLTIITALTVAILTVLWMKKIVFRKQITALHVAILTTIIIVMATYESFLEETVNSATLGCRTISSTIALTIITAILTTIIIIFFVLLLWMKKIVVLKHITALIVVILTTTITVVSIDWSSLEEKQLNDATLDCRTISPTIIIAPIIVILTTNTILVLWVKKFVFLKHITALIIVTVLINIIIFVLWMKKFLFLKHITALLVVVLTTTVLWMYKLVFLKHITAPIVALLIILVLIILVLGLLCRKWRATKDDDFAQRHKARENQENIERGKVMNAVKQYLSKSNQYSGLQKLNDLGCRLQKFWFQITSSNGELLLTIAPVSRNCALQLNRQTIDTLDEILMDMKKKSSMYINTVHKIDYISLEQGNGYVIIIQDWWNKGSLRDVIQNLDPKEDWVKLKDCGNRLPREQIVHYGKQILEALLFYIEEGFPPLFHIHSGNIYIDDDDTVRVGGYENTLLGYRTRLYRTFHDKDSKMRNWKLIDVFLFGHVMYEMATGQSLQSAIPTDEDYSSVGDEEVAEILKYIFHFNKPKKFRQGSISAEDAFKKIQVHKFFKVEVTATKRSMQSKKKHVTELLQLVERGIPVVQQTYESPEQVDPEIADRSQYAAQQRCSFRWWGPMD